MLQIQENNGENGFISLEKFDCSQSYPRLSLAHQKGSIVNSLPNNDFFDRRALYEQTK